MGTKIYIWKRAETSPKWIVIRLYTLRVQGNDGARDHVVIWKNKRAITGEGELIEWRTLTKYYVLSGAGTLSA